MAGATTDRGYGYAHRKRRAELAPMVAAGLVNCARCGVQIQPDEPWDLGHDDHDRTQYVGAEHQRCNRATAGRRRPQRRTSRKWLSQ